MGNSEPHKGSRLAAMALMRYVPAFYLRPYRLLWLGAIASLDGLFHPRALQTLDLAWYPHIVASMFRKLTVAFQTGCWIRDLISGSVVEYGGA